MKAELLLTSLKKSMCENLSEFGDVAFATGALTTELPRT